MKDGEAMVFTTAQIKDFAQSEDVYAQAKRLLDEQAIVSLELDEYSSPKMIYINATIKDNKTYYEVNMSVDKDDFLIHANICSCEQHHDSFSCMHCTAVLLKLQAMQNAEKVTVVPTTIDTDTINLMNAYEEQQIFTTLAMNTNTKIHLTPILEIRSHNILALTLKVGSLKQYIIKDLASFLDDVKQHVTKSYGKDLSFLHHIDNFDEPSRKLLNFMQAHIHDTTYFLSLSHLQKCPQTRNLCFMKSAIDEFFDLYYEDDVFLRTDAKTITNILLKKENPDLILQVQEIDETFKIYTENYNYRIFEGTFHNYLLYDRILYRLDEHYQISCLPLLQMLRKKRQPLLIFKEHMNAFYHNVIMSLQNDFTLQGVDLAQFEPLPLSSKLYLDMPKPTILQARLIYCYGDSEYNAFSSQPIGTFRNFNEEIAVRLILTNYTTRIDANEGMAYIENSQDAIYEFFQNGFQELHKVCEIYATEKIKNIKIKENVHVSMGVRLESDLLHIDFDTFDFPMEELQQVLHAYRLNKKYYRMKDGSFVNLEDSPLSELSALLDGMNVKEKELSGKSLTLEKYRSLYLDNSMKSSGMIKFERDHTFKDMIRNISNIQDSDYAVPNILKDTLRNYQKTGFRWLKTMSAYGFCGILADDMGIGKTLQIITLLEDEKEHRPNSLSLVTCPSSLILNWQSEIERFAPSLTSLVVTGSSVERKKLIKHIQDYDVIITSYDYLKRDLTLYDDITFQYHIIDEAQYIKNHMTKNAQTVKQIKSNYRFALSGTPIENSLAELWSIFDFLMPNYLFNYNYFKNTYEIPIVKEQDQTSLAELKRLVEPFILRRIKKDVLKELPEKVEQTLFIPLDDEAKKLYLGNVATIRQDIRNEIQKAGEKTNKMLVLSMLTRLRQLCCDPRLLYENFMEPGAKLKACMELIENCIQTNKKVLIFSQFTSLLALIEDELTNHDIPYYLLKGSTPKTKRQQYVNSFNQDRVPVFLISLKAGGTGLNLTSAEVVIHFDPWWNVSAQNQATDRAYRIGQHNNVQVFKLIAKDTIEEKIMKLQEQKQQLSDSIIHNNEGMITNMSMDQIMDLF